MTRIEELRERIASSDAWWFENGSVIYKVNAACELVSLLEADLKEAMGAHKHCDYYAKLASEQRDRDRAHIERLEAIIAKHKDSTHDK